MHLPDDVKFSIVERDGRFFIENDEILSEPILLDDEAIKWIVEFNGNVRDDYKESYEEKQKREMEERQLAKQTPLPPIHATCPRCGGAWKETSRKIGCFDYACHNGCGMRYEDERKFFTKTHRMVIRIANKYIVVWDFNEHKCTLMIGSMNDVIEWNQDENPIYLPWLKFDVTEEKLKLYVLFS